MARKLSARLLLIPLLVLVVAAVVWRLACPPTHPPPHLPPSVHTPAEVGQAIHALDPSFRVVTLQLDDPDAPVMLMEPAEPGPVWSGTVLIEEEGHPYDDPQVAPKGEPIWRLGNLAFYGDPKSVEKVRQMLGR